MSTEGNAPGSANRILCAESSTIPASPAAEAADRGEPPSRPSLRFLWQHCGGPHHALDSLIYICLLLLVVALPHSKALTQTAYSAAVILWLIKLTFHRKQLEPQPLIPAMLAVLLTGAVSCLLSPTPWLSWGPMKSVALLLAGVLVAQSVRHPLQVRTLLLALLVSTMGSVGYTAWQYGYGIGAKLVNVAPASGLGHQGVLPGDIILSIDGKRVHNPREARHMLRRAQGQSPVRLLLGRGEGLGRVDAQISSGEVMGSTLSTGRPPRALGGLNHAVTYALVLLQIGLMVWGMLLSATLARQRAKWPLFVCLILICAAIGATGTRTSLVSMALAGFLALWMAAPGKLIRGLGLTVVVLSLLAASLWVRHVRGLGMVAPADDGTRYRTLMWEDGLRLTREHPFFGVGMDSIQAYWPQWNIRAYRQFPLFRTNFHSTPIQIAAERGLVTLAAYLWLVFLCLRLPLRLLRTSKHDWFVRGVALGVFGSTIGFLAGSLANYNGSEMQMLFWVFIGMTIALQRITGNSHVDFREAAVLTAEDAEGRRGKAERDGHREQL